MVSKKGLTVILTGPTAAGKSQLAIEMAEKQGGIEIINADSLLVYQEMNIGTAKPTPQDLGRIPHHLVNILSPDEEFTAGDFVRAALDRCEEIHARGHRALVVGGTGFYLKALLFGTWKAPPADPELRSTLGLKDGSELFGDLEKLDPESAYRIGPNDRYRLVRALEIALLTGKTPTQLQKEIRIEPDPRFQLWGVDRGSEELFTRISLRTEQMLNQGWVEETERIRTQFPSSRRLGSVGYAQICDYLEGRLPEGRKIIPGREGLRAEIELATRQLVKQQRTWFKSLKIERKYFLDQDRQQLELDFAHIYG